MMAALARRKSQPRRPRAMIHGPHSSSSHARSIHSAQLSAADDGKCELIRLIKLTLVHLQLRTGARRDTKPLLKWNLPGFRRLIVASARLPKRGVMLFNLPNGGSASSYFCRIRVTAGYIDVIDDPSDSTFRSFDPRARQPPTCKLCEGSRSVKHSGVLLSRVQTKAQRKQGTLRFGEGADGPGVG